jgi:hypothetical protein
MKIRKKRIVLMEAFATNMASTIEKKKVSEIVRNDPYQSLY